MINSGSEIHIITPAYIAKLGLTTQKFSVGARKINSSFIKTYDMTIAKL